MPHNEATREFAPETYPDFPVGFPTVELETISLAKLLANNDPAEADRVFEVCKGRGFFYLELPGCPAGEIIAEGANKVAAVAEDVFKLPLEEKLKYQIHGDSLDGYKFAGATRADKDGTGDTAEFFNLGKNESELIFFFLFANMGAAQ